MWTHKNGDIRNGCFASTSQDCTYLNPSDVEKTRQLTLKFVEVQSFFLGAYLSQCSINSCLFKYLDTSTTTPKVPVRLFITDCFALLFCFSLKNGRSHENFRISGQKPPMPSEILPENPFWRRVSGFVPPHAKRLRRRTKNDIESFWLASS
jgi:hypothetical protein